MRGLKLKCFGVGDGAACADRNHSAFLYRFSNASFILDCGEPVSRSFRALDLSYESVDRILLSHLHFDHLGGLFMLLQGFWLENRRRELTIQLPAEGIEPVRELLRAGYLYEELLLFTLKLEAWEVQRPLVWNGVSVTPFHTTHLASFRRRFGARYRVPFEAFSFLIQGDDLRIGHSADIGAVEDLEPLLKEPLDLLVCEVAHVRPLDLFAYLNGRPIKHIAFTHVDRVYWERMAEVKELAARLLPGMSFEFLNDQQELILSPSGKVSKEKAAAQGS